MAMLMSMNVGVVVRVTMFERMAVAAGVCVAMIRISHQYLQSGRKSVRSM